MRLTLLTLAPILTLALACGPRSPADMDAEDVVQSGCERDADCAGDRCITGLPGGLCTANCTSNTDCPEGTICTDTEATNGVCLFPCTSGDTCRELLGEGYTCDGESELETGSDVQVCIDA